MSRLDTSNKWLVHSASNKRTESLLFLAIKGGGLKEVGHYLKHYSI